MNTPVRSIHPKCPECGFSMFNRRFAKCESCGALLPTSIVYTMDELKLLREKDKTDEDAQKKTLAKLQSNDSPWLGGGDGSIDFSD
jgi:hypothetical protein